MWFINEAQQTHLMIYSVFNLYWESWTDLEAIILRAGVFSLGVGRRSELQRSRVDVEAAVFRGERGRHQLVVLRPGHK